MRISKSGDMISMLGKPSKNRWGFEISMLCLFHHTYATSWTNFDTSNIERSCDYDRPSPPPGPPSDNSSISASDFWEGSLRGECTLAYCWIWKKNTLLQVFLLWSVGLWSRWQICFLRNNLKGVLDNLAPRIRNGQFGTRTFWYPDNLAKFNELKLPRI